MILDDPMILDDTEANMTCRSNVEPARARRAVSG
jgi:hypothetical protein